MQLRKAERKHAKIKMALQGSSGSGKTYSALLLAYGLCKDWGKIALVDTENGSSELYAHLGPFNVIRLETPLSPEKYIEAINLCVQEGMEVIILDSISHCWDNLLDFHSKLPGNSFSNWAKVTPRHQAFINAILQAEAHVIATMRTKQDYVLNQKDGKYIPEKVGLKAVQRDGVDYEFTIVFDIGTNHMALTSKDRTGLFIDHPEFYITEKTGSTIADWCNSGLSLETVKEKIQSVSSVEELNQLYKDYREYYPALKEMFADRKQQILSSQKQQSNGISSDN